MKNLWALLSLLSTAAWAQSALAPPQVGFMQDSRHQIYPVNGLAGNFLVGRAAATGVVSAAFSGTFGLLKSDSALTLLNKQGREIAKMDAPPGTALFAFSENGSPALAYFEHDNTLRVWDGRKFQPVGLQINEAVLSIAVWSSTRAELIVARDDGLREFGVDLTTGRTVSQTALPGIIAPVLMIGAGSLLYSDSQGLVFRRKDGSETHIATHLRRSLAFGQMGEGWVQVTDLATGRLFAIDVQPGHEQFYSLPEVRQ